LQSSLRLQLCVVPVSLFLLATLARGSEMEKPLASDLGLRGPVKQCVEQTIYPGEGGLAERSQTVTWIYSPEGRLLQSRTVQSSGPDYATTYTYDETGRLLKRSSGTEGEQHDSAYVYDEKGRLSSINPGAGNSEISYEFDKTGKKTRMQRFPVFELRSNTAIGGMQWENSDLSFAPPSGGTVTTVFDDRDRPVEARISDAAGTVTMRVVRSYDEQGRIVGDQLVPEDMNSSVPEEMSAGLNDAQRKAMAKFIAGTFGAGESAYKYDSQGRVIEKQITGGVFGNEVTKKQYNDHGDVSEEETARTPTAEMGNEFSIDEAGNLTSVATSNGPGKSRTEVRYSYEYDAQGNWTEKTVSMRSEPSDQFKVSALYRRALTYY